MEPPRPNHARELFRYFAEPVLRVSATGETLEANPAFHELAGRCGVMPLLADLFGPAIGQLFGQARREGWTRALVPIMAERRDVVGTVTDRLFPDSRPMRPRLVDAQGWNAGRLAADLADIRAARAALD